jgi:competence protein ComEC
MPRAGWLALGAVVAALLSAEGWLPAGVAGLGVGVVAVAAVAVAVLLRRPKVVALSLGATTVLLRTAIPTAIAGPPPDPGPPPAEERAWVAEVITAGAPKEGIARGTLLLRPDPADLRWAAPLPDGWRVYAWLPRYPALAPGDRFALTGAVQPPPTDGSGFAEYLVGQSLAGTLRVVRIDEVLHGAAPIAQLETGRRAAADLVSLALPEPEGGLATGILIGIKERVSADVAADFATTGLSHVVAISGWNIALVGGVVGGLLAAAGMGRRGRSILVVLAIAAYTLLSGASASVVRAALMGGVAIAARASGRPGTASVALGLAVWLLVLAEPAMAEDIGFQLSVTATAGLLAWGDRISGWLRSLGGGRVPGWLAETLGVSLAAQLATLPLVLFHFGRLSLISPLANLLVAPLVAPAMVVSLLGLLGGAAMAIGVPALVLAPIALAGRLVLGGMIAIAHVLAGVPHASVTLPSPLDLGAAAAAAGLVAFAVRRGTGRPGRDVSRPPDAPPPMPAPRDEAGPGRVPAAGDRPGSRPDAAHRRPAPALVIGVGVAALVFVGAAAVAGRSEPRLTLSVLDVGQGDAILVQGPSGTRMLVDGGPDPDRLLTVLDERLPPWDRRIDLVVLTHPHEDHVAGLALLMERYRVGRIAENGMLGAGPGDAAFRERLRAEGRLTARLAAGDTLRLDGVSILAWWPERGTVPARAPDDGRAINDTSVVLDLRHGTRRFLLMGDVEDDVDPRLVAAGIGEAGRVDLLKVAHHGSRTASTAAFLAAIRPRVAVASAGTGNRYGHPAPSTMERLEAVGARALRTDLDGTVTISTDGRDLRVERSGGRAVRTRAIRELRLPDPGRSVAWLPLPCRIPGSGSVPAPASLGPPPPLEPGRQTASGKAAARAVTDAGPWLRPRHDPAPIVTAFPCYDRPRDDPLPVRGGRHPARPRRARHPADPHAGRRGSGRVPRRAGCGSWSPRGSRARRECGAPPRPGQGPPGGSPAAPPGARPRGRRVAHRARAPGARTGRGQPSGDAPRDRGGGTLAGAFHAGGADRGLRGQARRAASRAHRCAVPALVREAPPVQGRPGARTRACGDPRAGRVRGGRRRSGGCAPPALGR